MNLTTRMNSSKKFLNTNGFLPVDWTALGRLELLDMSENDFTGIVPPSIGALFSLEYLFLKRNQLNGSFPTQGMYLIKFYLSIFFFFLTKLK